MDARSIRRRYLYAGLLLVAIALALFIGLRALRSGSDARPPEQVVDAFFSALQSGNAAQALSLLSPDAEVFEMGFVDRTRQDYASNHLPGDLAAAVGAQRELTSRKLGGSGDYRWMLSTYRLTGDNIGPVKSMVMTETAIVRQIGDGWQIVHLHWSLDLTQ